MLSVLAQIHSVSDSFVPLRGCAHQLPVHGDSPGVKENGGRGCHPPPGDLPSPTDSNPFFPPRAGAVLTGGELNRKNFISTSGLMPHLNAPLIIC